jgi:hypothetical protein
MISHKTVFPRFFPIPVFMLVFSLMLSQCKSNSETSQSNDSISVENTDSSAQVLDEEQEGEERELPFLTIPIEYRGAVDNDVKTDLQTFTRLADLQSLARKTMDLKDSIRNSRSGEDLTSDDLKAIQPFEDKAHQAILTYKELMAAGYSFQEGCPSLLDLTRVTDEGDSTLPALPDPGQSSLLAQGNFFFLGGAPFVRKINQDDAGTFVNADGKAETRFSNNISENVTFLLHSLLHQFTIPMNVKFGPPLSSYEGYSQDIRGIGSLIHELVNRVPAFFITDTGLVPAELISIEVKLVGEGLGCISDDPEITFACGENLNEYDILGIYIPYNKGDLTSCTVTRINKSVWTADLNNDGIADLAGVTGLFSGVSSDTMAETLWYVNANGSWEIIDAASDPDCT